LAVYELRSVTESLHERFHNGHNHMPAVRHSRTRDDAGERLPALLQVHRLRGDAQAEGGRLLRVLFLRRHGVSSSARGGVCIRVEEPLAGSRHTEGVLTIYGVVVLTFMMLMYALERRGRRFVLAFACGCALSSGYGFLAGTWPFGVVEAVWSVIAVQRYRALRAAVVSSGSNGDSTEVDPAAARSR
jgi:hypothetical protein